MTKKIEPAVQVASSIENATQIISRRVAKLGGSYTEALVRIGMGEKRYGAELDSLATIYASISRQIADATDIIAPADGRVHIVRIIVDESVELNTAIDAGFPNTPSNCDIRKVADQYPAQKGAKPRGREIILVNFGNDMLNTDLAVAWGKENKLVKASPRAVFRLGSHKPQLHTELGQQVLVVASLEECNFSGYRHVPGGWWRGGKRKAYLDWPGGRWDDFCWFAFVREEPLAT
ncbi:MAG: hypothetical protein Q7R54_03595 [bacterium]|nr:hypothetical protein [bacterium]